MSPNSASAWHLKLRGSIVRPGDAISIRRSNILCRTGRIRGPVVDVICLTSGASGAPAVGSYSVGLSQLGVSVFRVGRKGDSVPVFHRNRRKPFLIGPLAPPAAPGPPKLLMLTTGDVFRIARTDIACVVGKNARITCFLIGNRPLYLPHTFSFAFTPHWIAVYAVTGPRSAKTIFARSQPT